MVILAGDIGATHARLGLFEPGATRPRTLQLLASAAHASLEDIIARFLALHPGPVDGACFALPGPVRAGVGSATNLGWRADAAGIARRFGFPRVHLLNDLEAVGHGLALLQDDQLETLVPGTPDPRGNRAILFVGTGLGEAGCTWDGSGHAPFASEGGHGDLAPRTDLEWALFGALRAEFGHVSVERVLSGPGLVRTWRFLRATGTGAEPAALTARLDALGDGASIAAAGLDGSSPRCALCLEICTGLLAAEAGNLALKLMSTGGVYLGGGVMAGWLPLLRRPAFADAFAAKGRMSSLLATMPLYVVHEGLAGLLGAARVAASPPPQ